MEWLLISTRSMVEQLYRYLPSPHNFEWVTPWGANVGDDVGFAIELDSAGNIYVGGSYQGTMIIGSDTLVAAGLTDAFVAKFDPNGIPIWARTGGGTNFDQTNGIAIDSNGNVYATGYFLGTADFSGGMIVSGAASFDIFVVKYDAAGGFAGIIGLGGAEDDQGRSLDFDALGNLYLAAEFKDVMASGPNQVTAQGEEDIVVVRMDVNLGITWMVSAGSVEIDRVLDMAIDSTDILITGSHSGTATFGTIMANTAGFADIYVAKLDTAGTFNWVTTGGGAGDDVGRGLAVDANGDILMSGYTQGGMFSGTPVTTVFGTYDIVVAKYSPGSALQWVETFGGAGNDFSLSLDVDGQNNPIHTGLYAATAYFGSDSISEAGGSDIFVAKLDGSGNHVWAKSAGAGGFDSGNRIAVNDAGEAFLTGGFTGAAALFDTISVASQGAQDIFLAKLTPEDSIADTVINLGAGSYNFAVFDANGSTLDTIEVMEPTAISLTGATTPATGTNGTDGTINLTVTGGTPGYTYLWSTSDATEDLSNLMTGNYDVTVTDANGCTGTTSVFVDTIAPFLAILVVTDVTCQGFDNGSIDLTVSGGTAPYAYSWSNTATTEDLMNIGSGTYTVTVTDNFGVTTTGTATVGSNPQNPSPTTDTIMGPTTAQPGQSYLYNVVASNGSTYSWNVTGGTINTSTNNIVSVSWGSGPTGVISLIETNEFGCQKTVQLIVDLQFTGVEEARGITGLNVYPNPAEDQLTLTGSANENRQVVLQMLDLSGRQVWSDNLSLSTGAFSQTLDVSQLAPGVYFLQSMDGMVPAHRVVIR